jgi:hypothetical protein
MNRTFDDIEAERLQEAAKLKKVKRTALRTYIIALSIPM